MTATAPTSTAAAAAAEAAATAAATGASKAAAATTAVTTATSSESSGHSSSTPREAATTYGIVYVEAVRSGVACDAECSGGDSREREREIVRLG